MKVLVVDDSPEFRDFLGEVARDFGVQQVDLAEDAEAALRFTTKTAYDLVTLDIRMPGGITGLDVLSVIRTLCPHAVIAMLSGFLADATGSNVIRDCANVCLAKPVSREMFVRLLELVKRKMTVMGEICGLSNTKEVDG